MAIFSKPKSLNAQIKQAEQQILQRQRKVDVCMAALVDTVQQQVPKQLTVTPMTLLLASGIGFIFSELSLYPVQKFHNSDRQRIIQPSPLSVAVDLATSIRTLYAALPLVWLIASRYQSPAPTPAPQQSSYDAPKASATAQHSHKSRYD